MRKQLILALLMLGIAVPLLGISSPVGADESKQLVVRDKTGRVVERWERDVTGGYVRRDPQSRRLGTVEPQPWGGYVTRNAAGKRTGTIEPRRY